MELCNGNNWTDALTLIYKENVVRLVFIETLFYCDHWKLNLTGGFFIFLFMVTGKEIILVCSAGKWWRRIVTGGGCSWYGAHDEAHTRVGFHVVHVEQLNPGNIVVRCNGTDILILILSNIQKFSQSHVWLDMGLDYNNSRTFIDVQITGWQTEFHPSVTWNIRFHCVWLNSCILQKR